MLSVSNRGGILFLRNSLLCLFLAASAAAQTKPSTSASTPTVCESCLRSEVEYLASDELRGRGSGTADELTAAKHVAGVFKKLGLEPAVGGDFIIPVTIDRARFTAPPTLKFTSGDKEIVFTHGKEILANRMAAAEIKGKLFHAKADPAEIGKIPEGSIVVIEPSEPAPTQLTMRAFSNSKAAAILVPASAPTLDNWDRLSSQLPTVTMSMPGDITHRATFISVKREALDALMKAPDGTEITIGGPTAADPLQTRNVVGILRGSDPVLKNQYVMFSAHMDHLGVRGTTGDTIYNGADDDASGTSTVIELARIFTKGERPKRSIMFVTYGSEELGLLGSRALAAKPPVPIDSIVADIEFEQTALPQEGMDGHFWMTGSQLSDLRAELEKHGSAIGDDPYPGNPFFRASDNYSLAARGVVAHTLSGAAEFPDYHKPGDEANKLNYDFLAKALEQALPGFQWLVNTDTKPEYLPGKNPAEAR